MKQSAPLTSPPAIQTVARSTPQGAARPVSAAFSTDMQGADLESLQRFNQALPDPKPAKSPVAKKKTDTGEDIQAADAPDEPAVSEADGEVWEMAQAAVAGAEAAADGAAGGGAGGAGAGVGAGTASNLLSPLLLTPLLLIPSILDTDPPAPAPTEPAPALAPAPAPAPSFRAPPTPVNKAPVVLLEHEEVKLVLNAESGEIECAVVSGTDPDNGPAGLSFFFWNNGRPSSVSADGYFSIDEKGAISLTELGTQSIGAGNPALPCAPSIELEVVAFDGQKYSPPKTLTIDRVLPTFVPAVDGNTEGYDALYSVRSVLTEGYAGNAEVTLGEHDVPHIRINDTDGNLDLIDFDGLDQVAVELDDLAMSRNGDTLCIKIEGSEHQEVHIAVENQFALPVDGEPAAAVEFVHFQQGTTYARYDLGGSNVPDDTSTCEGEYPYFQNHGVYLVSTDKATTDGDTVSGTVCNDVVVGSDEFREMISGGEGNDLLFAQGAGDTLVGGQGDDLIVINSHDHDHDDDHAPTTVGFDAAATNGFDTVVGFDEDTRIDLQASDTSLPLGGEDVDVFTDGAQLVEDGLDPTKLIVEFGEEDVATAVVAMSTESPWNLHSWLNEPSSALQEIVVDGTDPGLSLFFLVEEAPQPDVDTFTHLYQAADSDNSGTLSASEFTHMAQFAGVGVDAFSSSTFTNLPPVVI